MIGIISVIEKGDILGEKIKDILGGDLILKSKIKNFKLNNITKECFEKYDSIIFISSTGIAVRAISKYLVSKDKDPAVVVVDVCNKFSISLVSGHLGGANKLTLMVSEVLGNTPVITTATDNMDILAPDIIAMNNNLIIDDLKIAKVIAGRLVNREDVYFKDDKSIIKCPNGYIETDELHGNAIWITHKKLREQKVKESKVISCLSEYETRTVLKLIRKDIILGIGCKRNTDSEKLFDFVSDILAQENIDIRAVEKIASINIKSDEKAILDLAVNLKCDLIFFSSQEIAKVEHKYEGSEFVKKSTGVSAVSEPVIELAGGNIIVKKIKRDGMTLAIGELS
ncbi:cobalt-precorrin 5A hydrolase [Clostridium sp. D53t1_180928_C8]|uniref:cobalt-precorrin 5A hydrolase n=1 Tax=Clostridium sp. D53t1_180928_C8 TaxID=2787101 RepID=UPI0018AAFA19|nr:cobalt-precorrin 5A hydrolase [Clostridium sp. D53t1_180928_C8]